MLEGIRPLGPLFRHGKGGDVDRYDLRGRVMVITGANGGLGRLLARALSRKGARLALLDLDGDAVQAQAAALGDERQARGWAADVRDAERLAEVMAEANAHFGVIDVVVAGAGIQAFGPLETFTPEAFARVIDINLNGVWRTFSAALPYVKPRRGYLLAVSSMGAFIHSPLQAAYSASKAGVWAMCDSIRLELRPDGVGVGSLHPTFFPTRLMEDTLNDPAGKAVWGGNKGPLWKMVPIETVVLEAVECIERRAEVTTVPRHLAVAGLAPGVLRPVAERLGFTDEGIRRAVRLSSPTGWSDPAATARTTGQTPANEARHDL
ncbi:SDR family NAD(P)-dependent oxidoreductase [Deinococcus sp.]|uniref:SDR family NAD(P)-dependent oxidoreductase n=1 Tax=Deinococcus sp. TaxID=47478 RepID=UPI0025C5F495|nr:SDR family NAD(P)-dependent oxidoreductase [Deinococcus sp.]